MIDRSENHPNRGGRPQIVEGHAVDGVKKHWKTWFHFADRVQRPAAADHLDHGHIRLPIAQRPDHESPRGSRTVITLLGRTSSNDGGEQAE